MTLDVKVLEHVSVKQKYVMELFIALMDQTRLTAVCVSVPSNINFNISSFGPLILMKIVTCRHTEHTV